MPITVEEPPAGKYLQVNATGRCSHAEILAALRDLHVDVRFRQARVILCDLRAAQMDLTSAQIREAVRLMGEYRSTTSWGTTIIVAPDPLVFAQCRMAITFAEQRGLEEQFHLCRTLDEARKLIEA